MSEVVLVSDVNWQELFELGKSVLVLGKRESLKDGFFNAPITDYACGSICELSDKHVCLESFFDHTVSFLLKDITGVAVLP